MSDIVKIAQIIREFGEKNFASQSEFARAMGMRPTDLFKYTSAKNPLPVKATMRERLASVGLTSEYITQRLEGGNKDPIPLPRLKLIDVPVYQSVSAGTKGEILMEDVVEYVGIPMTGDDSQFGVVVKGNSMAPRVNNGDVVIVSQKAEVRSGELAIVFWNDGECALRVVHFSGDNVSLSSENPAKYPPIIVSKSNVHRLLRVMLRMEKF